MRKPFRFWKRGRVWYYRLSTDSTWHSTHETNKNRAEGVAAKALREGRPTKTTFQGFVDERAFFAPECRWSARHKTSEPVRKARQSQLERFILPKWGKRPIGDITAMELTDWLYSLELSQQTRKHLRTAVGIIFDEALRSRRISRNPVREMETMASEPTRRGTFEPAEIARLFPKDQAELEKIWAGPDDVVRRWRPQGPFAVNPRGLFWASFFLTMATSGLRGQEVRGLVWGAVILEEGGLLVLQAVHEGGGLGPPKGRSYRAVPLPKRTLNLLGRWRACTPYPGSEQLVFFGARKGEPLSRRTELTYFAHGLAAAGIQADGRTLSPHSFRHFYNAVLRQRVPEVRLRELTGHKSETMTSRYDHPEVRALLVQRLQAQSDVGAALQQAFGKEENDGGTEKAR